MEPQMKAQQELKLVPKFGLTLTIPFVPLHSF